MSQESLSLPRLYILRAMYAFVSVGLFATVWPNLLRSAGTISDPHSVINALIGSFGLICLLGLRYPIAMLPLLVFELLWKALWVAFFGLPLHFAGKLDAYGHGVFGACLLGVIITPLVLPWGYLFRKYVKATGERWR